MSKISIIVPVYNVEKYIRCCIDSILAQTYYDFELILVDDGSQDSSGMICNEYSKKDDRVFVIKKENGGLSDARNAGINWVFKHSDSEWISFVDSDDWIHPAFLSILLKNAEDNMAFISACYYKEVNSVEEMETINTSSCLIIGDEDFICDYQLIATVAWGKLYKKELFSQIRFPLGRIHEDEFVTYKIICKAEKVVFTDEKMYFYRQNDESIMHQEWSPRKLDCFDAFSEQIKYYKKNKYPRALGNTVFWYAFFMHKHIQLVKDDKRFKKYLFKICLMFKFHLIKYSKKYLPFKKNYNYFEDAFPAFMFIFWNVKSFMKKIRKDILK